MTAEEAMQCERCGKAHTGQASTSAPGCIAHRRDGDPCGNDAMRGQRVCRMHGGSTPGARENAEQRRTEEAARQFLAKVWDTDAVPITSPILEMQRLAGSLRVAVDALGERLDAGDLDPVRLTAWTHVLREQRQLLGEMGRLNLGERQVEVEEWQGQALGHALVATLAEIAELSPELRDQVIRGVLGRLGRGPELLEVEGPDGEPA